MRDERERERDVDSTAEYTVLHHRVTYGKALRPWELNERTLSNSRNTSTGDSTKDEGANHLEEVGSI